MIGMGIFVPASRIIEYCVSMSKMLCTSYVVGNLFYFTNECHVLQAVILI